MTHAHFAYGWVNPLMGFGFALAGSYLGLTCMMLARRQPAGRARVRWLFLGSLAIGGTGIWMMHFIAMIGFSVTGGDVRYDLSITALSLVISIISVAFGLFVVGLGRPTVGKVLVGGPLTGMGVVAMHYTGMAAVNISGTIHYDPLWVAASVAIALVAATVALFFTTWVAGRGSLAAASLIMAAAVCGMHYTGMGAVSVEIVNRGLDRVPGVDPLILMVPILLLATVVLVTLIVGVLGGKDDAEDAVAAVTRRASRSETGTHRTPRHAEPVAAAPAEPAFWSAADVAQPEPDAPGNPGRRPTLSAAMRLRERPRPFTPPRPREAGDWERQDADETPW
ncbi:NO-binding membrane sensor protein with MHYT domain [Stackebrandtia albiflava]|uniref:NO-binding membrane sensor protein with MHYT domain n=1 Tax=Stackebrandtia albiflava TaxID=406432 RepID=A0A562V3Z6_9ACTN|nr:MHYT domain-containing protein [Stackebrandtia albiflava]TWJ12575.1 NO-binding membrane sensor protein with MHYT domain [Stackebrandtia albiflava]